MNLKIVPNVPPTLTRKDLNGGKLFQYQLDAEAGSGCVWLSGYVDGQTGNKDIDPFIGKVFPVYGDEVNAPVVIVGQIQRA